MESNINGIIITIIIPHLNVHCGGEIQITFPKTPRGAVFIVFIKRAQWMDGWN